MGDVPRDGRAGQGPVEAAEKCVYPHRGCLRAVSDPQPEEPRKSRSRPRHRPGRQGIGSLNAPAPEHATIRALLAAGSRPRRRFPAQADRGGERSSPARSLAVDSYHRPTTNPPRCQRAGCGRTASVIKNSQLWPAFAG
ncbi:hypothetical protein GCM10010431_54850 [Streptomyces kunmingensis]